MRRLLSRHASVLLLSALAAGLARAPVSYAMDRRATDRLPVVVEQADGRPVSFGTLRSLVQGLKNAGHTCTIDRYEHGVGLACDGTPAEAKFYLDMTYAPSRAPEMLQVDSMRAQGRNGGETPSADRSRTLGAFSNIRARPFQ